MTREREAAIILAVLIALCGVIAWFASAWLGAWLAVLVIAAVFAGYSTSRL